MLNSVPYWVGVCVGALLMKPEWLTVKYLVLWVVFGVVAETAWAWWRTH